MSEVTISVGGMTCSGCEGSVVRALSLLDGVTEVVADHVSGAVRIIGEDLPDRAAFSAAVEGAGYDMVPEGKKPLPMA